MELKRLWFNTVLTIVISAGVVFSILPSSTFAEDCDAPVADDAKLFGSRLADVEEAAQRLVTAGAEVHVITIESLERYGGGDQFMARMQRTCDSWRSPEKERRENLVVFLVSVRDRQSFIFYGGLYNRALDSQWSRIRTDLMNPRFRQRDFADGVIAGINETARLIDEAMHPQASASPPTIVVQPQGQPSQPTDLSGLWKVMGWGLGLISAFGAIFGIFSFLRRQQEERERRRAAQQRALSVRRGCSQIINELKDPVATLMTTVGAIANMVDQSDSDPLKAQLATLHKDLDQATVDFSSLGTSSTDPDREGLSVAEYRAMEEQYAPVLNRVKRLQQSVGELERAVRDLQALITAAQPAVEAAATAISAAEQSCITIAKEGFKIDGPKNTLGKARNKLSIAAKRLGMKQYGKAKAGADEALELARQATKQTNGLPEKKVGIERAIEELAACIPNVRATIEQGREAFNTLSVEFAVSSWKPISGNGTESEKRVARAEKELETAQQLCSMEVQDWETATAALEKTKNWLDEAESLIRSITELRMHLDEAKRDAPKEVEAADADVWKAAGFEQQYDADVKDAHKEEITNARTLVERAQEELKKEKPDYLKVVKLAHQANDAADRTLAESRSEHEEAERKRQKAATLVRDATRSVSMAKEYFEDHKGDISHESRLILRAARAELKVAETEPDLERQISLAESALKEGKKALKKAEEEFETAESLRRAAREHKEEESVSDVVGGILIGSLASSSRSRHPHHDSGWGIPDHGGGGGGGIGISIGGGGGGGGSFGGSSGGGGGGGSW